MKLLRCLTCAATAAMQLISTSDSPGKAATATVVRAGPPWGKYVEKTLCIPSQCSMLHQEHIQLQDGVHGASAGFDLFLDVVHHFRRVSFDRPYPSISCES